MNTCILCEKNHAHETVEHIVPRSLGNLHYILPKGTICASCNNKMAKIENAVVSSHEFVAERSRLGVLKPSFEIEPRDLSKKLYKGFLCKILFESLYKSKRRLWESVDWTEVRKELLEGRDSNSIQYDKSKLKYRPIPGKIERWRLNNNYIHLAYFMDDLGIFFRFQYGRLLSSIRLLLNRD